MSTLIFSICTILLAITNISLENTTSWTCWLTWALKHLLTAVLYKEEIIEINCMGEQKRNKNTYFEMKYEKKWQNILRMITWTEVLSISPIEFFVISRASHLYSPEWDSCKLAIERARELLPTDDRTMSGFPFLMKTNRPSLLLAFL